MAYNTYLTYSAITNNPNPGCNRYARDENQNQASVITGLVVAVISVTYTAMSSAGSLYAAVSTKEGEEGGSDASSSDKETKTNSTVNPASPRNVGAVGESYQGAIPVDEESGESKNSSKRVSPDSGSTAAAAPVTSEGEEPRWKAFSFHLELFLAGCYVAMMASNWGDPSAQNLANSQNAPELSLASMWARMGTQFAIHLLFTWILIAPLLCKGRRSFA